MEAGLPIVQLLGAPAVFSVANPRPSLTFSRVDPLRCSDAPAHIFLFGERDFREWG